MKVIEYSAWAKPIIHTVKNSRDAKRLAARLKYHDQKLTEILTEKQYKSYPN